MDYGKPYGMSYEEWQDWKDYQAELEIDWRDFEETYGDEVD